MSRFLSAKPGDEWRNLWKSNGDFPDFGGSRNTQRSASFVTDHAGFLKSSKWRSFGLRRPPSGFEVACRASRAGYGGDTCGLEKSPFAIAELPRRPSLAAYLPRSAISRSVRGLLRGSIIELRFELRFAGFYGAASFYLFPYCWLGCAWRWRESTTASRGDGGRCRVSFMAWAPARCRVLCPRAGPSSAAPLGRNGQRFVEDEQRFKVHGRNVGRGA